MPPDEGALHPHGFQSYLATYCVTRPKADPTVEPAPPIKPPAAVAAPVAELLTPDRAPPARLPLLETLLTKPPVGCSDQGLCTVKAQN
jgi:hypothetical protein